MAESASGEEAAGGNETNPFSFKSFVKRASTDSGVKRGKKGGAGRERKTRSTTALSSKGMVPFPEEGGDNPFSFKQFVKKQTLTEVSEGSSSSDGEHILDTTQGRLSAERPALPLPTTTTINTVNAADRDKLAKKPKAMSLSRKSSQSSPVTTGKDSQKSTKQKDKLFNDTDSDSDSFTSTSQDISLSFPANVSQKTVASSDPLGVLDGQRAEVVSVLRLSDSSDDSVAMTDRQGSVLPGIQSVESQSDHLLQQCTKLTAENKQLKLELETFKEKYQKEKQKNSKLDEQLQALKKKEAEETKALEDMVAKVEENLVASTKRAMTAEVTVSRLKQEMQNLQAQLSQADTQSVHKHYEELLSGVRDKATFSSRQLSMAAMAADQSIRELLSGVDTLKNVAEVLEYIDRISEVKQR